MSDVEKDLARRQRIVDRVMDVHLAVLFYLESVLGLRGDA